jgi:S-disulfanyl-L-cysteine oxidoreductase SoxD
MVRSSLFALCVTALLLGCSNPKGGAQKPPASAGEESQVARGGKLYGQHCASCHGASGEGSDKGPAVVGKAALPLDPPASAKARTAKFHTAKDVADFVVKTMPADAPGSLTPDEYLAVLAFDLNANGIDMTGKKLEMANLGDFVIHP